MKANKKILLVGNTAWSMFNFRLGLMKHLRLSGYDVSVAAPNDDHAKMLVDEGFPFFPITKMNNKGTDVIEDLKLYREFIALYKEIQPDIVFHYTIKPNIYGTLAAHKLNIKSLAITTGLGFAFTHKGLVSTIVKQLYRFSLRHAEQVWFLNTEDRTSFLQAKIVPESKTMILPGEGIDTTFYASQAKHVANTPIEFLFSSRLILDKGIEVFVKAILHLAKKGSAVKGNIVGFLDVANPNGISKEELDNWTNNPYINYLGATKDIRPFIEHSDCLVLPSYYREGVPRILMEAAAMCKPIITTDNVGCRDVVEHQYNGFLCKVKDYLDLAQKMEDFCNLTDAERSKMGENGRAKMINQFSDGKIFSFYTNFLKDNIRTLA